MKPTEISADILPRLKMYSDFHKELRNEMSHDLYSISCVKKAMEWFDFADSIQSDLEKLYLIFKSVENSSKNYDAVECAKTSNDLVAQMQEHFEPVAGVEIFRTISMYSRVLIKTAIDHPNSDEFKKAKEELTLAQIKNVTNTNIEPDQGMDCLLKGMRLTFGKDTYNPEIFEYFKSVSEMFVNTGEAKLVDKASSIELAIKNLDNSN